MFLMVLIFVLLLVLSFVVILVMTRPSSEERTIEGRIVTLQDSQKLRAIASPQAAAIVKLDRLSQNDRLDQLLQGWALAHHLRLLIAQAESSWSVPGMLAAMLLLAIAGYGVGYWGLPNPWLPIPVAVDDQDVVPTRT